MDCRTRSSAMRATPNSNPALRRPWRLARPRRIWSTESRAISRFI